MKTKFIYHHCHPGFDQKLIEDQLFNLNLLDGTHKVILQNDHPEPCACVNVSMFDPRVFWAFRGSRRYPSPMIMREDAEVVGMQETYDITVIVKKKGALYRIITCYAGPGSPKEPSTASNEEYADCVAYWSHHALVPDEEFCKAESLDEMPQWVINAYLEAAG